ncbi:Eaa protein [Salmonella enterica]|nr:Eaa protein [Salmonella enterica]
MSTITRERLLKIQQWRETYGAGSNVMLPAEEAEELARIALASLTAEPVRYLNKFSGTCVTLEQQSNAADDVAVYIPLYATPPAPVVPEKMNFSTACNFVQINGMAKEDRTILAMRAWNACRAAMLNGGKS